MVHLNEYANARKTAEQFIKEETNTHLLKNTITIINTYRHSYPEFQEKILNFDSDIFVIIPKLIILKNMLNNELALLRAYFFNNSAVEPQLKALQASF